ncbi:hypothetical protein [Halarchaeum grantii]|nr:hypothetical protein [Halarchaeum grantii]
MSFDRDAPACHCDTWKDARHRRDRRDGATVLICDTCGDVLTEGST